ncbi:NUDIX hydrolase domain-like protein [Cokeromyces recurvatus]|uniref:NUDIX hydrolase domain-like protein n=1 Tax=Cokeromyces recurvatus TaxID=90255 RepID=UPI00221FA3FB|nr:NUDIX hydrolase domain-like protein [Cokeromyces recurvatus]KAI7900528.1 NUDIX hydrolase domain-like protein [Cokeromyces recurvatus]
MTTPITTIAQKEVRVGVGCLVTYKDPKDKQTRILVGQRAGSHGAGTWQLPGGHLEMFEEFEQCARREVLEETNLNLSLKDIKMITATNDIMPENKKHYVTIFMWCQIEPNDITQVKVMEPHKLQGEWEFITLNELKQRKPLFSPLQKLIDQHDLSFLD